MPAIDPIPTPPPRTSPDTIFSPGMDASLGAIPLMITQMNAAIEAMNLNSTNSTSATSMLVENATKTFVVQTAKSYVAGQTLKIAYTTDPTIWMVGDVISYNAGTGSLVVATQYKQGSGTYATWTISLSPPVPSTIPMNSKMVFFNNIAPTGWLQDSSYTGGYAIRVVSGAGAAAVSSGQDFTAAFASRPITGTNSAVSLTKAQIPQHTHTYSIGAYVGAPTRVASSGDAQTGIGTTEDGYVSGLRGDPHNHAFTGTALNMTVKYLDMILATKQ